MAMKKQASYKDYWSSDPCFRDEFIANAMSRERFTWLLVHLHLNDNQSQPKRDDPSYDRLYRVRLLLEHLNRQFQTCYNPSEIQSVDYSVIKFKGRSSIKHYMPMKRIRRGYKVWVRADSSGYVCQAELYTGRQSGSPGEGLGESHQKPFSITTEQGI